MTEEKKPAPQIKERVSIYKSFIEIQKGLSSLDFVKDRSTNKNKYITLKKLTDTIRDACNKKDVGISFRHKEATDAVCVGVVLFNEYGEELFGGFMSVTVPKDSQGNFFNSSVESRKGGQYGAQAFGSADTYAERYALKSFFFVEADEDDDGARASQMYESRTQKQQQYAQQPQPQKLDLKKVEDGLRGCSTLKRLEALYQNAIHRADGNQTAQINAIYKQIKQSLTDINNAGLG